MLIAAALIELGLPESDSLKDKRRVLRSLRDRVRAKFNVAIAEIADQDDRHRVCLGCVSVGSDPRYLREGLEKVVRYVESLALGELVSDDVIVVQIDELPAVADAGADLSDLPEEWERE
jgi:uncharacterized protein YlxP (DUF503 family)